MGFPAEELIIRPFQEVVERGREAVANAQEAGADADGLARAGHALVREGERALKRLQPVWGGQVAKYGNAFKEAILQRDDIEAKRRLLEDLLYDFEDYIEPASFDADKFAELQAATRAFALDVINHAKRLKLALPVDLVDDRDVVAAPSPSSQSPSPSPLSSSAGPVRGNLKLFPHMPSLPPMPPPPTSSIPPIPPIPTAHALAHENQPRSSSLARRPASARGPAANSYTYTNTNTYNRGNARNTAPPNGGGGGGGGDADDDAFFDMNMSHSPEVGGHMFPSGPALPRHDSGHMPPAARGGQRISTQSSAPGSPGGSHSPITGPEGGGGGGELLRDRANSRTSSPAGNASTTSTMQQPQPRTSATTAWVARQQSGLTNINTSFASATRSRASLARARASRDTTMSADSFLSQPYAMSTGGATATTAATTASSPPSVAGSPILTDARTSFFSTSYDETEEEASCAPVLPFIAPPISASTAYSSGSGGGGGGGGGNRFSDVIQFAPSPVMPPITLPVSTLRPKTAPQALHNEYEFDVVEQTEPESDADPDAHAPPPPPVKEPTRQEPPRESIREPVLNLHQLPELHDEHDTQQTQQTQNETAPLPERPRSVDATPAALLEPDLPFTHHEVREPDCSIGPQSSFKRMGGFCAGANACRETGHWRGIELTSGYVGARQRSIGRCVGCGYAHAYNEVRLDKEKKPEATFTKSGVRFRLRLLYKSHMAKHVSSQRQADSMYGCVFCAHTGATPHEGDATVFINVNDLLAHISRHPRPLPKVAGITVLYGEGNKNKQRGGGGGGGGGGDGESTPGDEEDGGDMSSSSSGDPDDNDFDLHFPDAHPMPWPVPADVAAQSAVAVAVYDHMQWPDEKPLDRPPPIGSGGGSAPSNSSISGSSVSASVHMTELLPFLAGARIVGIAFPVEWEGKWCVGWHGGVAGAFPARLVRIQMPQPSELPMESSSSGMSVVARWRWRPEVDKEEKRAEERRKAEEKKKRSKEKGGGGGGTTADGSSSSSSISTPRAAPWLPFDKGEVISNVQCLYADHWCWAGTNSKGRFGVFPQSHILPSTLQQASSHHQRPAISKTATVSSSSSTTTTTAVGAPSVRSAKSGWAARSLFHHHKGGGGGGGLAGGLASLGGGKSGKGSSSSGGGGGGGKNDSKVAVRPLSGSSSSAKTASSVGWPGF